MRHPGGLVSSVRRITCANKKDVADAVMSIGTIYDAVGPFHSKAEKDMLSANVRYLRRAYVCCVRRSTQRCSRTSMTSYGGILLLESPYHKDPDVDSVAVGPRRHVREGCEATPCGSNVHGPQQTASDRATSKGICAI